MGESPPEEIPSIQLPIPFQKLFASDANANQLFGESVAVSGDTLAVGSRLLGAVYFFDRAGAEWTEVSRVPLPEYGIDSLALDGDLAVAGVTGYPSPGRIYVLRRSGDQWEIEATIEDVSADGYALFGNAVAISGETIVVGARGTYGESLGAAYTFVKGASGWEQEGKLMATGATPGDQCGYAVAVAGDWITVTCPQADLRQALLFRRENGVWTEDPSFPPNPSIFQQGLSVALDGKRLVVGDNAAEEGHVFLNEGDGTWTQDTSLTASPANNLAYSVALAGDIAVLGGLTPNSQGTDGHGNAYAFVHTGGAWSKPVALVPEGGPIGAGFGQSTAASGSTIVISAAWDDEKGEEAGSVYVFELDLTKAN